MSRSTAARELARIGSKWPTDILRPRLQYGSFLGALSQSEHLSPRAVRASQFMLENRLKEKYALTEKTMLPASYPDKYTRLVALLEAGDEDTRSWWQRFFADKE